MATRDVENGPVLGTPDDFSDRPERQGRFVVHVVIAILVAIVAGGWGYVMWTATGQATVPQQVVAFDASRPDSAGITFEISRPAGKGVVCRLRATDANHVEVGSKEVKIPAGEGYIRLRERLDTSAQASSVHIQACYLV
ncbi:DUF4307 domain-containing protein [Nonomuraea dietziae]|jgi:hypothetical protein